MRNARYQTHMVPLEVLVKEAIGFIREHEPPEGYFVAFSGGKDSIVTLELTHMAGVRYQAYYSATGIDPPEVVRFIRENYPEVKWLRPRASMYVLLKEKFPPLRRWRWCCDELKELPSMAIPLHQRLVGVRAEESASRKERQRIDALQRYPGIITYKPIFYWYEWHIWDFIHGNNLAYPVLYDEGFDRIGCVVCPYLFHANQSKLNQHRTRWPGIYKAFEHAVMKYFNTKGHNGQSFQEYLTAYYRGFE